LSEHSILRRIFCGDGVDGYREKDQNAFSQASDKAELSMESTAR
jgi:hypothetical protein